MLQSTTENKWNEGKLELLVNFFKKAQGFTDLQTIIIATIRQCHFHTIITHHRKHSLKTSPPTDSIITFAPLPPVISFTWNSINNWH